MQEVRKKFTYRIRFLDSIHTGMTVAWLHILVAEVRSHERRGKTADSLGSSGSEATGDPLRSSGKPGEKHNADSFSASDEPGEPKGVMTTTGRPDSHCQRQLAAKKQDRNSDPVSYLFSFSN